MDLLEAAAFARNELGVPGDSYPAPVRNAYVALADALHRVQPERFDLMPSDWP